jgi:hypothetical protein
VNSSQVCLAHPGHFASHIEDPPIHRVAHALVGCIVEADLPGAAGGPGDWGDSGLGHERGRGGETTAEFSHRYGERINDWTMPASKTKRDRLAQIFGTGALAPLRVVHAADARDRRRGAAAAGHGPDLRPHRYARGRR